MEPKLQGSNEIVIHAAPSQIWAVLEDSARIPEYFPSVSSVEVDAGVREAVGATRRCQVEMGRRQGEVVERCTEAVPERKLTHVMDKDPFGFSRLFGDFGFSFILEPKGVNETRVRIEGFYRERTLLGRAMNTLMMRRKLSKLRARILANLKSLVEAERHTDVERR